MPVRLSGPSISNRSLGHIPARQGVFAVMRLRNAVAWRFQTGTSALAAARYGGRAFVTTVAQSVLNHVSGELLTMEPPLG